MLDLVMKRGKKSYLPKGEHIYRQGDKDGNLYAVASGLLKVYYTTNTGKEFVKSFIDAGGYIASISAMLNVDSCPFSIVALEDSQLVCVTGDIMLDLKEKSSDDVSSINSALLKLIQKKEQREFEFLCLSAEERYIEFKKEYENLESRVSQYDVARYLGITPVALSRIRKRC